MADIQRYERILKRSQGFGAVRPRLTMILIYGVFFALWAVLAVITAFAPAVLVLAVLSMLILILPTWKYTSVEYEYSFVAGTFTFSKIYGKSRIKQVFESDLRRLVSAKPMDISNVPSKDDGRIINCLPDGAVFPVVCLFEDGDENKYYVLMDCDAMTARILKFFKISAVDREISRCAIATEKED